LTDIGPVDGIAVGRYVINAQSDEITAAELAIDSQIEHRQVTGHSGAVMKGHSTLSPYPGTPDELANLTKKDYERFGIIIQKLNIKAD